MAAKYLLSIAGADPVPASTLGELRHLTKDGVIYNPDRLNADARAAAERVAFDLCDEATTVEVEIFQVTKARGVESIAYYAAREREPGVVRLSSRRSLVRRTR